MPEGYINKLAALTRAKLRSTQILTSLPQIVSELVQNSLDAGANVIDIGVDCEEWVCWVRDNGSGISKDGLAVLGNGSEEGRYGTSKSYSGSLNSLSTFGFRGEALASAANISCLEISSRTANSRETWSVITKGGKSLYSGPAVRWRRDSHGTVVCLRDAFYNLPVRRLSHPPGARSMELIRQELETFSLAFPSVAFTLENVKNGREASSSRDRTTRIPKTSSTLASFRNLYGRALTEHVEEIELSSGELRLDGFISLNGAHSKAYQFLFINRHHIARCDLHHVIDSRFASSSFSKNAFDEAGEMKLPRPSIRRSPRKIEKKPVYVLNLTVPYQDIDNCLEPAKNDMYFQDRGNIIAFLASTVHSFLVRHGFSSQTEEQQSTDKDKPPPRKRRKTDFEGDSGYGELMDADDAPETNPQNDINTDGRYMRHLGTLDNDDSEEVIWTDPNTGETFVVNVRTGNSHPQTERPPGWDGREPDSLPQVPRNRRTISYQRDKTSDKAGAEKECLPEWLQQALKSNQAYRMTEPSIPTLMLPSSLNAEVQIPRHANQHDCDASHKQHISHFFQSAGIVDADSDSLPHRFRKTDLRRAQVISQVDRKFIACLIENQLNAQESAPGDPQEQDPNSVGRALVLIDQHAADERVRVERFLKELCLGFLHNRDSEESFSMGVRIKKLSPPLPLLVTLHEAQRLESSQNIQQAFRHWGFSFVSSSKAGRRRSNDGLGAENNNGYTQVLVQSIPEIVGDKLLLGDELRDLVKGFLGQLESETEISSSSEAKELYDNGRQDDEFSWLKALRWCPRELLDLINSKACRGAIMFNDSLNINQCETLVRQLSETAFPFQCAHGRPSLVPLANIGVFIRAPTQQLPCNWSRLDQ